MVVLRSQNATLYKGFAMFADSRSAASAAAYPLPSLNSCESAEALRVATCITQSGLLALGLMAAGVALESCRPSGRSRNRRSAPRRSQGVRYPAASGASRRRVGRLSAAIVHF